VAYRNNFLFVLKASLEFGKDMQHGIPVLYILNYFGLGVVRRLNLEQYLQIQQQIFNTYEIWFVNAPTFYIECDLKCASLKYWTQF
jgi:hypothetical protein